MSPSRTFQSTCIQTAQPSTAEERRQSTYVREISPTVIAHEFAHYVADIRREREKLQLGEVGDMAVLMDLKHAPLPEGLWHIHMVYWGYQIKRGVDRLKKALERFKHREKS